MVTISVSFVATDEETSQATKRDILDGVKKAVSAGAFKKQK